MNTTWRGQLSGRKLPTLAEYNFDGLVGPTHNYAGLSPGNLASERHGGSTSTPKAAALQGLQKMRLLSQLGVGQGVLPPQPRPCVDTLRRLGFSGTRAQVLKAATLESPQSLRLCSSASAMWTANAATVGPKTETTDGRTHLVPANLAHLFHRQLESSTTRRVLAAIFSDPAEFEVHQPLPATRLLGDEGAANHNRFCTTQGTVHLFAWGRCSDPAVPRPQTHPARQSLDASQAVARLLRLEEPSLMFVQQDPRGIDAGAFHTDVLAVGGGGFFMLHEYAFRETSCVLETLNQRLGRSFRYSLATNVELDVSDAVRAYPFNSQLVSLPIADGTEPSMALIAPLEAEENLGARRYLERVLSEDNPVQQVLYQDVRQSMSNGGGPACLRLRVELSLAQAQKLSARVLLTDALYLELTEWVERFYPERLTPADLADPALAESSEQALDELTQIMRLGSIYDFQR